jgi:hypothetical protein
MMFEGVSKDDVNYRMQVYSKTNKLYLFYPNGIVCVYENIIGRRAKLAEVIQCDYDMLLAPQIIGDSMIAVSVPNKSRIDQGMLLIRVPMEAFEQEIT